MSDSPSVLWLPALTRFAAASPLRRMFARADRLADGAAGHLDALAGYFATGATPVPVAALTRELARGDAGDATWLCADPAWIEPELTGARLLACGRLALEPDEVAALAEALQPLFLEQGMTLETTTPERWHLRVPAGLPLPDFPAPEQALGAQLIGHLPEGPAARRWRVLLTDIQVTLHQHPLNAARRRRGLPPVNSLWLWGGGVLPARVTSTLAGACSDDALVRALAARAGMPWRARDPDSALPAGWLLDLTDLDADAIDGTWWPHVERWACRQPLLLHLADGQRRRWRPWHRLRVWRDRR
ncbi:phosphoglycerate mutase [Aerosticca soli]|uniref:Regulatory protein, RpfE type n=1 Tax=Aerosticca soli TaxID=2010829 RepID=A0A2Z6E504_9GAMM|nr:phosphoglycerate mutase [Aerosticca soli]MDI3261550.1 phosphoglycerate mutase [Fulvimonas sp.]BBD79992.1 regulatory protein, RpfE type [Aerosticca soli]